jgi:hypothetical protein
MMELDILIPCGVVTAKAVAWGGKAPELFLASQEAIRHAVQTSSHRQQLQAWLESRTRLSLYVEFHLSKQRAGMTDLDSLLADLFNPLVEGACGPRAAGKPIPQTKDALFWRVEASKVVGDEEKTIVRIRALEPSDA